MGATSVAKPRREAEGFFTKYIVGRGLDIGCGMDPLTPDCRKWDVLDGDAQTMPGDLGLYDWVYSSHCLEHMVDPSAALQRWWALVRQGGYLIVSVPDEDLYEMGMWPSHLNIDHKSTWNLNKKVSWSPVSRSLLDELEALPGGQIEYVKQVDTGYDRKLLKAAMAYVIVDEPALAQIMERFGKLSGDMICAPLKVAGFWPIDQTSHPFNAEASVEGVLRKL